MGDFVVDGARANTGRIIVGGPGPASPTFDFIGINSVSQFTSDNATTLSPVAGLAGDLLVAYGSTGTFNFQGGGTGTNFSTIRGEWKIATNLSNDTINVVANPGEGSVVHVARFRPKGPGTVTNVGANTRFLASNTQTGLASLPDQSGLYTDTLDVVGTVRGQNSGYNPPTDNEGTDATTFAASQYIFGAGGDAAFDDTAVFPSIAWRLTAIGYQFSPVANARPAENLTVLNPTGINCGTASVAYRFAII